MATAHAVGLNQLLKFSNTIIPELTQCQAVQERVLVQVSTMKKMIN